MERRRRGLANQRLGSSPQQLRSEQVPSITTEGEDQNKKLLIHDKRKVANVQPRQDQKALINGRRHRELKPLGKMQLPDRSRQVEKLYQNLDIEGRCQSWLERGCTSRPWIKQLNDRNWPSNIINLVTDELLTIPC